MTICSDQSMPQCPRAPWREYAREGAGFLRVFMFLLGFLTIGAQVLLVRAVFSVLYGSDVAIAFALASWTLFSGLGAYAVGPLLSRLHGVRSHHGLALYSAIVLGVYVLAQRWGAGELIAFRGYILIPCLLCVPCLLGGGLFSWGLREAGGRGHGDITSQAYAFETLGGLVAGLALSLYFFLGGLSEPALIVFCALCFLPSSMYVRRWPTWALVVTPLAALLPALLPVCSPITSRVIGLHYPGYEVLDHRNTPFGAVTALERNGETFVFVNGTPVPDAEDTPAKRAVAALVAQFASGWDDVLVLQGVSQGFEHAVAAYSGCEVRAWEFDRRLMAFLAQWTSGTNGAGGLSPRISASPWSHDLPALDAALIFAQEPGSLMSNRFLTDEFLGATREHLRPGGVVALVLPIAPGFVHPRQERYLSAAERTLRQRFPHVLRLHTDLGHLVFVGGLRPLASSFRAERFRPRVAGADEGIEADVRQAFADVSGPNLSLSDCGPGAGPSNSVAFPVCYFAYLRFRGAVIEEAAGLWDRLFRRRPAWIAAFLVAGFLLVSWRFSRQYPHSGRLFWTSWIDTMSVMLSLYLYQSIVGQAYWMVAVLIAGSMLGLFLGARREAAWASHRLWGAALWFPLAMFLGHRQLAVLPNTAVLALLLAGNWAVSVRLGVLFRQAAKANESRPRGAEAVFCIDLLGAACGLLIGAVLLPWWVGFREAGLLCGVAATAGSMRLSFPRRRGQTRAAEARPGT